MNGRRRFVVQVGAGLASFALGRDGFAMGRVPLGGRIALHVPWFLGSMDPHDLSDPAAALFATAVCDSLYGLDAAGNPYPTLAAAMPSAEGSGVVVRLREGLRTGRGASLDARDVLASIARARAGGARALLARIPPPSRVQGQPLAAAFKGADAFAVARALSSPLTALVPRGFSPAAPDGTGAFRAELTSTRLLLRRNPSAARGPSFLDQVDVASSSDLKTSLRAFESEQDDVGWLGMGLYSARKQASRFDLGGVGWIVLTTGPEMGSFGMPGVAQRLADALPAERFAHLGLDMPPRVPGDPGWGGPPTELCVDEGSAHLVEIAQSLAPVLSRPGHEVTPTPLPRAEMARRAQRKKLGLALGVVRSIGRGPLDAAVALTSSDDIARAEEIVKHPPRFAADTDPRTWTATLRLGIIGTLRISGGTAAGLVLARGFGDGWDLGSSYWRARR